MKSLKIFSNEQFKGKKSKKEVTLSQVGSLSGRGSKNFREGEERG